MLRLITYIMLAIIAGTVFVVSMLIAGGLNPVDVITGVWGAQ